VVAPPLGELARLRAWLATAALRLRYLAAHYGPPEIAGLAQLEQLPRAPRPPAGPAAELRAEADLPRPGPGPIRG
jgi:hypothetical protein